MTETPWWMLALVLIGCAADPKSNAADPSAADGGEPGEGSSSWQTIGALDPDQVKAVVAKTTPEVDRCVARGRKRLPILGGEVALAITVGPTGRAESAVVTQSTLGDQTVEGCIVRAFSEKVWPRPVGGKIGKIDQRFEFDSGDTELALWQAADLAAAMAADEDGKGAFEELVSKLSGCRKEAGAEQLQVTMYLDEDGIAQAAGVASPDGMAPKAAACVETVVKTTSFPSPGKSFAKVTVAVP